MLVHQHFSNVAVMHAVAQTRIHHHYMRTTHAHALLEKS